MDGSASRRLRLEDRASGSRSDSETFRREFAALHKCGQEEYDRLKEDNPVMPQTHDNWALGITILEMFTGTKLPVHKAHLAFDAVEQYKSLPRDAGSRIARWSVDEVCEWAAAHPELCKMKSQKPGLIIFQ